mmetsp:Transcript_11952/g.26560  ORF Transcript_11952/g.26560 Transcript_11952/m.26560 type:complete len:218 (-) Transcript_11952:947-1600(-)
MSRHLTSLMLRLNRGYSFFPESGKTLSPASVSRKCKNAGSGPLDDPTSSRSDGTRGHLGYKLLLMFSITSGRTKSKSISKFSRLTRATWATPSCILGKSEALAASSQTAHSHLHGSSLYSSIFEVTQTRHRTTAAFWSARTPTPAFASSGAATCSAASSNSDSFWRCCISRSHFSHVASIEHRNLQVITPNRVFFWQASHFITLSQAISLQVIRNTG